MFRQSKAEQLRNIYFKFCIYVCVYMIDEYAGAQKGQKRVSSSLELGLQVVVSCPIWVLGTNGSLQEW